jgi:hypothetical protein
MPMLFIIDTSSGASPSSSTRSQITAHAFARRVGRAAVQQRQVNQARAALVGDVDAHVGLVQQHVGGVVVLRAQRVHERHAARRVLAVHVDARHQELANLVQIARTTAAQPMQPQQAVGAEALVLVARHRLRQVAQVDRRVVRLVHAPALHASSSSACDAPPAATDVASSQSHQPAPPPPPLDAVPLLARNTLSLLRLGGGDAASLAERCSSVGCSRMHLADSRVSVVRSDSLPPTTLPSLVVRVVVVIEKLLVERVIADSIAAESAPLVGDSDELSIGSGTRRRRRQRGAPLGTRALPRILAALLTLLGARRALAVRPWRRRRRTPLPRTSIGSVVPVEARRRMLDDDDDAISASLPRAEPDVDSATERRVGPPVVARRERPPPPPPP